MVEVPYRLCGLVTEMLLCVKSFSSSQKPLEQSNNCGESVLSAIFQQSEDLKVPEGHFQATVHLKEQDEGQHLFVHFYDSCYIFCHNDNPVLDLYIHVSFLFHVFVQFWWLLGIPIF